MTRLLQSLRQDWPSLLALLILLEIPPAAVATAEWAEGLRVLALVVLVALVASYLLAVSDLPDVTILLMGIAYGVFTVWVVMTFQLLSKETADIPLREAMSAYAMRFYAWLYQAFSGGFSRDTTVFVAILGMVCWFLSFNAAVNLFRTHSLWIAIVPPGLALLINNYWYFGEAKMELFLIAYLFLAFMLAALTNASLREKMWRSLRVGYAPGTGFDLVRGSLVGVIILLAMAWSAPTADASTTLSSLWDSPVNPWNGFTDTFSRVFSGVEGAAATTADYYGGTTLTMGGPVNLSSQTVMYVYAPDLYRYYWRSKVFTNYNGGRWTSQPDRRDVSEFGVLPTEEEETYLLRRTIQQRVEIIIPASRLVYGASQPLSFSTLPIAYDLIPTAGSYATITAVYGRTILTKGREYGVTSSLSGADQTSLRTAGTDYPEWVRQTYLQLPDTITQRTHDLAASIAAPYDNPFDKARAIEQYLREHISYNAQVSQPPQGAEPVDYLLFERPEGYCNYYASAMIVMLRSQGIPARMAAGFAQGERDPDRSAFRVAEDDAHTWVEAYFPHYGWIEFEPTVIISPIVRPEVSSLTGGAFSGGGAEPLLPDSDTSLLEAISTEEAPFVPPVIPDAAQAATDFHIPEVVGWLLMLAVVIIGGGAGVLFWLEQRGLSGLSAIQQAYARINIFAPLIGIGLPESDTPFERARIFGRALPAASKPVETITRLYVQEQYGPPPESPMQRDRENQQAREAWLALRPEVVQALLKQIAGRLMRRFRRQ